MTSYSVLETADFLPQFIHKPANFEPGHGCRYNNVGFILLGLPIHADGQDRQAVLGAAHRGVPAAARPPLDHADSHQPVRARPRVRLRPGRPARFLQKDGLNAGASGLLRYYPDTDLTVVLLSNTARGVWQPARDVDAMVRARRPPQPVVRRQPVDVCLS